MSARRLHQRQLQQDTIWIEPMEALEAVEVIPIQIPEPPPLLLHISIDK